MQYEGQTYRNTQGTGKATVLPAISLNGIKSAADLERAKLLTATKAAQAKQSELKTAFDKLNDENFDGWYQHESELSGQIEELKTMGTDLFKKGENPYTSTSVEAQAFRTKQDKIKRYSEYSNQLKDEWTKTYAEINKNPDKFLAEDRLATVKYFEMPLANHLKGSSKPLLRVKAPEMHLAGMASKLLKAVQAEGKDVAANQNAIITQWKGSQDARTAAVTDLANLKKNSPKVYAEMEKKATYQGVSVLDYHLESFMKSLIVEPDFNINEFLEKNINIGATETSYTNPQGGSSSRTTYSKKDFEQQADDILASSIRLRNEFTKNFNGSNYSQIEQQAKEHIVNWLEAKYKDEKSTTADPLEDGFGGYSRAEADANFDKWFKDFSNGLADAEDYTGGAKGTGSSGAIGSYVPKRLVKDYFSSLHYNVKEDADITKEDKVELKKIADFVEIKMNESGKNGLVIMPSKLTYKEFFKGEGLNRRFDVTAYRNYIKTQITYNLINPEGISRTKARDIYNSSLRNNKFLYKDDDNKTETQNQSTGTGVSWGGK